MSQQDTNRTVYNAVPSISIYGCGGAGINIARKARDLLGQRVYTVNFLDTSHANIRQNEHLGLVVDEDAAFGSGKHRSENADRIVAKIPTLSTDALEISDVNIVVHSMAGGSGSVIGPVLAKEIAQRVRSDERLGPTRVIVIAISDVEAEKSALNTLKTLQTLQAITTRNNVYLPISIFDNRNGQDAADAEAVNRILQLVDILTLPAAEVDRNDRLAWLNAAKTIDVEPGLRALHITVGEKGTDLPDTVELLSPYDSTVYDSLLHVRTTDSRVNIRIKSRVPFNGIFVDSNRHVLPMLGLVGNKDGMFTTLINNINDVLRDYGGTSKKHKTGIVIEERHISNGDVIV